MFVSGGCDSLVKVWRQEQVGSWVEVRERFLLNLLNPDLTFWPPRSTRLSFTVAGCKTLSGCLGPRCRPFSCSCSLHQVCLDQEYEALNHTPDKDLPFWTCSCLEGKGLGLLCPGVYPSPDLLVWPLATSWTCSFLKGEGEEQGLLLLCSGLITTLRDKLILGLISLAAVTASSSTRRSQRLYMWSNQVCTSLFQDGLKINVPRKSIELISSLGKHHRLLFQKSVWSTP